jgi:hypothetical protein
MVKKGRVLELEYKTDEKKQFKKGKIRFLSVVATKTILGKRPNYFRLFLVKASLKEHQLSLESSLGMTIFM